MSLRDTRDIGTAKIVMLGGGGGGGSYTAGNGINITNNTIINTRKGALTGVIDSVSSNIAHTQIDNALTTTTAGALVVLKAEASGTSIDTVRVQYGAQASESRDFRLRDTSGSYTTIDIASGDTIIMMLNATGYQMIVLSILGASTGGGYAGLGIGKKTGVSSNIIDTDIDLYRSPMVGDRLLVYFDEKITNPTGLNTYNNGVAVTSNLENAVSLYINAGWNILEFKNDGLLYDNCWVRKQNVPVPSTLAGMSDTLIVSPSDNQLLVYDDGKWKNKKFVEANMGFSDTELKKIKVGDTVYDTDGLRDYFVTNIANNNITISVLNSNQFVMENIAINTGAYSGSSSAWNLVLNDGMNPVSVALKNADGTAFSDDIHENELLFVYVDTAGNVAKVLDIPVNTTEIKTVTGNPITLTDAIAGNALEVSAEIVASQDLHGYDKPWAGGAGKNKLPMTVSGIKALNTEGTWSGNVYTNRGVTFTVLTDNDNNVIGIKTNGVPTNGNINFNLCSNFKAVSGTTYTISGSPSGVSDSTFRIFPSSQIAFPAGNRLSDDVVADRTRTAAGNEDVLFFINIFNGVNVDNKVFYPQIEIGSQATTFAPYSNICPITGFSSVVITNVDSESHTATVTVSLGSTVYGGTLDLTTGELTITHANIASYNGETIGEPWISSMDEYTEGGTPTTGAQVVYTLATPTTTTLTAAQLALVKGQNTLTCNSGDMSITYKASGLDALKERVDDLEDAVEDLENDIASKAEKTTIGTVENSTTASRAYAVGEHFIRNDKFCTAIASIASGATLTQGTNYVEGTIAECIARQGTYSTTETKIGTWLGHDLYRKVIDTGTLPNSTEKLVSDGISGNIRVISLRGAAFKPTNGEVRPLPFASDDLNYVINVKYLGNTGTDAHKVYLYSKSNYSDFTSSYVVLEYIKL